MSRIRSDALTADLFSTIPTPMPQTPASMDFRRPVAQLVTQLLKDAEGSRYVVAARMSELADVETSKALLDSYTAETREECNLPLWKAPLIEAATGSRLLAEWHAGVLGGRVLWGAEITDADIGRCNRQIAELQEQLKALQRFQKQQPRGRR
ncbi:MAG TPA: hypothetical protein VGD42_08840 [Lysobacter sp.]